MIRHSLVSGGNSAASLSVGTYTCSNSTLTGGYFYLSVVNQTVPTILFTPPSTTVNVDVDTLSIDTNTIIVYNGTTTDCNDPDLLCEYAWTSNVMGYSDLDDVSTTGADNDIISFAPGTFTEYGPNLVFTLNVQVYLVNDDSTDPIQQAYGSVSVPNNNIAAISFNVSILSIVKIEQHEQELTKNRVPQQMEGAATPPPSTIPPVLSSLLAFISNQVTRKRPM